MAANYRIASYPVHLSMGQMRDILANIAQDQSIVDMSTAYRFLLFADVSPVGHFLNVFG